MLCFIIVRVFLSFSLRVSLCIILHICLWDGVDGFVMHVQIILFITSIYLL